MSSRSCIYSHIGCDYQGSSAIAISEHEMDVAYHSDMVLQFCLKEARNTGNVLKLIDKLTCDMNAMSIEIQDLKRERAEQNTRIEEQKDEINNWKEKFNGLLSMVINSPGCEKSFDSTKISRISSRSSINSAESYSTELVSTENEQINKEQVSIVDQQHFSEMTDELDTVTQLKKVLNCTDKLEAKLEMQAREIHTVKNLAETTEKKLTLVEPQVAQLIIEVQSDSGQIEKLREDLETEQVKTVALAEDLEKVVKTHLEGVMDSILNISAETLRSLTNPNNH